MSTATAAQPGTRPARQDPFAQEKARLARYKEHREFFDGDQFRAKPAARETRITVNYARALLRKTVSYVFPAPTTFSIPPPELPADPTPDAAAAAGALDGPALLRPRRDAPAKQAAAVETLLGELLDEIEADRVDASITLDSAVIGDGAAKVTWDPAAGRPRLTAVDPATLIAWWSPDRPTDAYRIQQHYELPGAAIVAAALAAPGSELAPDKLYPVIEDWTAAAWTVSVAGQTTAARPNPYGWIPYLVLPNNHRADRFWGESDLPDLLDVCRALNRRLSVVYDVLELSGAPIAVIEGVDGTDGIDARPGAKWELPEGAKAYLLDLLQSGGVQLHIDYIEQLRTALHDLAETPRTAFGEAGRALSGTALEVELQPLVQRVKRKRRGLEAYYRRRNAMLLDLMERFAAAPIGGLRRTLPLWAPILPTDKEADARVEAQLIAANVRSRRSAAAALGEEDPDAEFARVLAELAALAHAQPAPEAASDEQADQEEAADPAAEEGTDDAAEQERSDDAAA